MNFVEIEIVEDVWRIKTNDSFTEKKIKTSTQLNEMKKQLEGIASGFIRSEQEVFVQDSSNELEVTKWLTEELGIPFVYAKNQEQMMEKIEKSKWELTYYGFSPGKDEYSIESLLTVGNGFLGLRGTTPEMEITENNYPATYVAGLYNQLETEVSGQKIYNEDFVNAPNFQKIYLKVNGEKVVVSKENVLFMKRTLDLKNGLFQSWLTIRLENGKQLEIHTKKIVNMVTINQYNLQYTVKPLNFSGKIEIVTEADGTVYNYNVERYRSLSKNHLDIKQLLVENEFSAMKAMTTKSKLTICQFSKIMSETIDVSTIKNRIDGKKIIQQLELDVEKGQLYQIEKSVIVQKYDQKENIPELILDEPNFYSFKESFEESFNAWRTLWDKTAITITGDIMSQKLVHLHTYHLLVSASPNGNRKRDVSVTARGLHGEAYRGHIFWDELFILPFYILHFPETAKDLLMYRYNRLNMAKQSAKKEGNKGAMYPWQSGLDGSEQSQKLHLNPMSGKWKEDHSHLQRHVSLAIAYNVWFYWHNTQDDEFMEKYGLEMLFEIAHYWESKAVWEEKRQKYSISGVMGPDEFHEKYPWSDQGGLKNNAYTNIMVTWLFEVCMKLCQKFSSTKMSQLQGKIGMSNQVIARMKDIQKHLALEINENGVIAQFEGYTKLKLVDWDDYREKYGNIYRMDRILNAEGKSADDYQLAKQADSLMVFYNLSKNQVNTVFSDLGYYLPHDYLEKNLDYYLARTSHGSTLSRVVHAQIASKAQRKGLAWQLYQEALYSDYRDIQGGTTAEGIHTGVMSATLHLTLSIFGGLDVRGKCISLSPSLPDQWQNLSFSFTVRQVNYQIYIDKKQLEIIADEDTQMEISGTAISIKKNQKAVIIYNERR